MIFQEMHYRSNLLIVVYGDNGLPIDSYTAADLEHSQQIQAQLTLRGYKGIMGYSLNEFGFSALRRAIEQNKGAMEAVR